MQPTLLKGQTSQRSYYCDDATGSEPPAKQPRPNHAAVMFLLDDCASQQATEDCNFDNYLNFPLTTTSTETVLEWWRQNEKLKSYMGLLRSMEVFLIYGQFEWLAFRKW